MRKVLGAIRDRVSRYLAEPLLRLISRCLAWSLRPQGSETLLRAAAEGTRVAVGPTTSPERAQRALEFWFRVHDLAARKIGQASVPYYSGRHPKHHRWIEHNRYLFDAVHAGDRVIDIGCGSSAYPQWIAEKASMVVGVDLRPDRIALARSRNDRENVRFEQMDVTEDLPEGAFDLAICSHCLEHLDEPVVLLEAIARRVPRIVVKVPLADSHWMKLVRRDIGIPWMDDADHRREYDEGMLREQLEAGGWRVIEIVRGFDLRAQAVSDRLAGNGALAETAGA